jgi:hypothetical protein
MHREHFRNAYHRALWQPAVNEVLFFQSDGVAVGVDLRGYHDEYDILFGCVERIGRDNQCRSSFGGTEVGKRKRNENDVTAYKLS